jgi:pimeloyl-ACP methyl ester carboxylesterase
VREGIASLPLLLYELRSGDRLRAARELLRLAEGTARADRAVFWLVQCFDQHGAGYGARLDSVGMLVWRPMRSLRDNLQECPTWQTRSAAPAERAPVASDIRTLVVTGEFDPRTPIEFGRRIASTLSRSHVVELPGETHGGRPSACRAAIMAEFLNDPAKQPDASCISRMQPIHFRTTWPQ